MSERPLHGTSDTLIAHVPGIPWPAGYIKADKLVRVASDVGGAAAGPASWHVARMELENGRITIGVDVGRVDLERGAFGPGLECSRLLRRLQGEGRWPRIEVPLKWFGFSDPRAIAAPIVGARSIFSIRRDDDAHGRLDEFTFDLSAHLRDAEHFGLIL